MLGCTGLESCCIKRNEQCVGDRREGKLSSDKASRRYSCQHGRACVALSSARQTDVPDAA